MRIHADHATATDIRRAARYVALTGRGSVHLDTLTEHRSRSRRRAFEVKLTGSNPRRNASNTGQAATWDEWGWFLAALYSVDAGIIAGPYQSRQGFDANTRGAFTVPLGELDAQVA
jgi:uncharacterized glyoxalase superfamily metalloenzyme YdcJ